MPRASSMAALAPASVPEPIDRPGDDWRLRLPETSRRRLRAWFWSIAAMTLAVVVIGGITRLTHSGLSIVEWQPLMGAVPPVTTAGWTEVFERYQQFPEYRQLRQGMTLAEFKVIFFWEYLHRLVARLIGVVFLVPFVVFWRAGYLTRPLGMRALGLFGLGLAQGAVGWLMVQSGLVDRPSVSHYRLAVHLTLALAILGVAVWLARELAVTRERPQVSEPARRFIRRGLTLIGALLVAQIVWGAFVAGLRAGLFYNTFPLMADGLLPPSGLALEPAPLNLVANPVTVQWMHRLLGTVLLVSTGLFFLRVRRIGPDRRTHGLNAALLALIAVQYLAGVLILIYRVPVTLGVVHQAIAVFILGVWVAWMHHVRNMDAVPPTEDASSARIAGPHPPHRVDPARPGVSLRPREHGAYGQVAFPLIAALAVAGPSAAGTLLAAAVVAGFLAHEPAVILLGLRGSRALRENRARATRWLAACAAAGAIAGAGALLTIDPPARWSIVIPLAPALLLAHATARGREKSWYGELAAVLAFSGAAVPVSLAGGVPLTVAGGVAIPFALLFAASTLAVRVVILRVRGGGDARTTDRTRRAAFLVAAGGALALAAAGALGPLPWPVLAASAPGLLTAAIVAARPPAPAHLRFLGWSLVAVSVVTLAIVVVTA